MINVNGLKRNAKNIVKKYSDAQIKVREATSNDPWGPSSTIMAEIADLTYNVVAFSEIMQMIWKRINDNGKNWRHVYKALILLEYLIKTGTEKVAQQCIENIFAIKTLQDFQYMEDNKDHGTNIREKSKKMVALLKDSEKLKAERARALKAKSRLAESMSSIGKGGGLSGSSMMGGGTMFDSTTNNGNSSNSYLNYHNDSGGSSSSAHQMQEGLMSSELDSARPRTENEFKSQLELALKLSKEEAEQQEKTQKNDDIRLKIALDASKKNASSSLLDDFNESPPVTSESVGSTRALATTNTAAPVTSSGPSKSAIDDLLGLTIPGPSESIGTVNLNPGLTQAQHTTNQMTTLNTMVTSTTGNSSITTNTTQLTKNPFLTMTTTPAAAISTTTATTAIAFNQPHLTSHMPVNSAFPEPQNDPWSTDPWSTPFGK